MPTYQYVCTQCDEALEVHQAFSDAALTVCPVCQGRLRKVFNAVGVVFKGSGFYRTDSRSKSDSSAASNSSTTPAKSDTSTSPAPASKPTASSESSSN